MRSVVFADAINASDGEAIIRAANWQANRRGWFEYKAHTPKLQDERVIVIPNFDMS